MKKNCSAFTLKLLAIIAMTVDHTALMFVPQDSISTARNCALNKLAKRNTEKRGSGEYPAALEQLSECLPFGENPEQTVDARLLRDAVCVFLESLAAESRMIFVERYMRLSPVSEIAEKYGISISKVKVTLLRTRRKLKSYLKKAVTTTAAISGTDAAAAAKTSAETTAALSGTESAETTAAEPETQRYPAGDFDLDGRLTQADILLASMMMSLEKSGTDLSLLPLTEAQMQQADIIPDSVHQNGPLSEAERDALYQTVTLIRHCGFPELTIPDYLADQARYDAVCQQRLADRNAARIKAGIEQIDWAAYGFSHTPTYEEFCDMTSLNMEEKLDGKGFLNIWNQLSDRKWETLSEEEQLDITAECMRLRHIPDAEEGTVLPSNTMIQNYIFSLQHRDEPDAYEDYTGETEPPAWDAVCALIESAKG